MSKTEEATGRIKIVRIPDGEAPLWVREVWVGLILPCYPHLGHFRGQPREVLAGQGADQKGGAVVPQDQAMAILKHHNRDAAAWWEEQGFPEPEQCFVFGEDEVEIISGVTPTPTVVYDDMETGRWRPALLIS